MATKAGGEKPMALKSIPAAHDQAEKKLPSMVESGKRKGRKQKKKLPSMVESGKRKGRKQKKKMRETFKCYIYRVLKQVHPDLGISIKAIAIVDCFVNDIFDKLVGEAIELSAHSKKTTITAREIRTSTKIMLPGELAKHAICEGGKGVTMFSTE